MIIKILNIKDQVKSAKDFLKLCALVDQFKSLNYSKKRTVSMEIVKETLIKEGFLTP